MRLSVLLAALFLAVAPALATDLALRKTGPETATVGDTLTYTIVIDNTSTAGGGPYTAPLVELEDLLPSGLRVTAFTTSNGACVLETVSATRERVRCNLSNVDAGATETITITAVVESNADGGASITNQAVVRAYDSDGSSFFDPNLENNTATATTELINSSLSVEKSASVEVITAGDDFLWTVTITNSGDQFVEDVELVDQLVSYESGRYISASDPCTYDPTSVTVSCLFGGLDPGETKTVTINVFATGSSTFGELTNTATVTSSAGTYNATATVRERALFFTYGDAAQAAVEKLVDVCGATAPDDATVYVRPEPVAAGTEVASFKPEEFTVTLERESWLGWYNCTPELKFTHPTGVLLLPTEADSASAPGTPAVDTTLAQTNWWLTLDGEPYLDGYIDRIETDDLVYGEPADLTATPPAEPISTETEETVDDPRICAILVSGKGNDAAEQAAFDSDVDLMAGNLRRERLGARLSADNVVTLKNATAQEIETQLDGMRDQYDKIYFYYSGHGDRYGMVTNDAEAADQLLYLTLASKLYGTNAPNLCLMLDACHSGAIEGRLRGDANDFEGRNVTLVTASNSVKLSYTSTIGTDGTGTPIRGGFFTWHFALCYGDPAADANGDGVTSFEEAYACVIAKNPALGSGTLQNRMSPQLVVNRVVSAAPAVIRPEGTDVTIRPRTPLDEGARVRVEVESGVEDVATDDAAIRRISTGRHWSISLDGHAGSFEVDLEFRVDASVDDLPGSDEERLGLARRGADGDGWTAVLPSIWDPTDETVTALGVTAFSDWAVAMVDGASAVAIAPSADVPERFALDANYPNPFNPTTQIAYRVPEATHIDVVIYDAQGRVVRRLVGQRQPAGHHTMTWNGTDDAGRPVPSGVYLYRLQAGAFHQTRAMVLVQ